MKRRNFGLKADGIKDDDLYVHLESLIVKHGSYRAVVEDLLVRDKMDRLGYELRKVKQEIVQDILKEVKEEIRSLKTYIDKQLSSRTFALDDHEDTTDDFPADPNEEKVYDIDELEVIGEIEEEYEFDF